MSDLTNPTDLTAVSLFDGIGGFPLALSRAGIRTTAAVEIDKAAAGVAACHFPGMTHFSDVTEVTGDQLIATGFDPARGIVTAGWPCTNLSLAGLRLGLGGARSGLVGEVFRLLAELRPRWVLLENVPGLLSSVCPCPGGGVCDWTGKLKGKRITCADGPHVVGGGACGRRARRGRLTGAGRCMALHGGGMGTVLWTLGQLGYGVAYRILDAQHFGVPQRRRRVVIVGCLGDRAAPVQVLLEPGGGGGSPGPVGTAWAETAGRAASSLGISDPVSTLQGGGRRGYRIDAESAAGGHLIVTDDGVRRLTPVEWERLQGFPDGWTGRRRDLVAYRCQWVARKPDPVDQADSPRYRQLGNSIAVPVFEWVARRIAAVDADRAADENRSRNPVR